MFPGFDEALHGRLGRAGTSGVAVSLVMIFYDYIPPPQGGPLEGTNDASLTVPEVMDVDASVEMFQSWLSGTVDWDVRERPATPTYSGVMYE